MYVARRATASHGTYQLHLMLANVVLTVALMLLVTNPTDYAVIFVSSGFMFTMMEFRMARMGLRKSTLSVMGRTLSPFVNCALRGFTEGPGFCVQAFLFADCLLKGQPLLAWASMIVYAGLWSAYSGFMDLRDLKRLPVEKRITVSRRWMNSPRSMIGIQIITALSLAGVFLMPQPWRTHGFYFLFGTFFAASTFFLINGLLGVRVIEVRDEDGGPIRLAAVGFTIVAFGYDCLFEMAFFFLPYYLIPYALGLFTFKGVV